MLNYNLGRVAICKFGRPYQQAQQDRFYITQTQGAFECFDRKDPTVERADQRQLVLAEYCCDIAYVHQ